ncbi:MAG: hypothetical protein LBK53_06755 [Heliobacteriaceae bacterium]|jgi:hypothetical protein|nr:hypothetical protein [Heliobacteriaceae bacterium]
MSVTVSLVPLVISGVINILATAAASVAAANGAQSLADNLNQKQSILDAASVKAIENALNQNNIDELVEKEYTTVFADEKLLVKTLKEHGCTDFNQYLDGGCKCKIGDLILEFTREVETAPYKMKIICDKDACEAEIFSGLNSEYGVNVQEEVYLKIKERLENQNLKIDEEEVLEDNSIMLTINIEG